METVYSTTAMVAGGRQGEATLSDIPLAIKMTPPNPNSASTGNNPEQLFAMGYGACFDSALNLVKMDEKAKFDSITEVHVELQRGNTHDYNLAVTINVIAENTELSAEEIERIAKRAHEVCPYSKAIKGNIDVELTSEVR